MPSPADQTPAEGIIKKLVTACFGRESQQHCLKFETGGFTLFTDLFYRHISFNFSCPGKFYSFMLIGYTVLSWSALSLVQIWICDLYAQVVFSGHVFANSGKLQMKSDLLQVTAQSQSIADIRGSEGVR